MSIHRVQTIRRNVGRLVTQVGFIYKLRHFKLRNQITISRIKLLSNIEILTRCLSISVNLPLRNY